MALSDEIAQQQIFGNLNPQPMFGGKQPAMGDPWGQVRGAQNPLQMIMQAMMDPNAWGMSSQGMPAQQGYYDPNAWENAMPWQGGIDVQTGAAGPDVGWLQGMQGTGGGQKGLIGKILSLIGGGA